MTEDKDDDKRPERFWLTIPNGVVCCNPRGVPGQETMVGVAYTSSVRVKMNEGLGLGLGLGLRLGLGLGLGLGLRVKG